MTATILLIKINCLIEKIFKNYTNEQNVCSEDFTEINIE